MTQIILNDMENIVDCSKKVSLLEMIKDVACITLRILEIKAVLCLSVNQGWIPKVDMVIGYEEFWQIQSSLTLFFLLSIVFFHAISGKYYSYSYTYTIKPDSKKTSAKVRNEHGQEDETI